MGAVTGDCLIGHIDRLDTGGAAHKIRIQEDVEAEATPRGSGAQGGVSEDYVLLVFLIAIILVAAY